MLLNVKAYVEQEKKALKAAVAKLVEQPVLNIISFEDDSASNIYMRNKIKLANDLGIYASHHYYDIHSCTKADLASIVEENANDLYDGIIIQIPANRKLDDALFLKDDSTTTYRKLINAITSLNNDVDGLSNASAAELYAATSDFNSTIKLIKESGHVPCTAAGIINYLIAYASTTDWCFNGKSATVVGRSELVGKPLALLLTGLDCTVSLCHSRTANLKDYTTSADLVVIAIGKPNFFDSSYFSSKQVIIDVGISRVDSKICGDVDISNIDLNSIDITPVPGGVGLLTTLQLMKNTYINAAKKTINSAVTN